MIISASRRTDIPAFFSEWFMNRVRAGYCCVPNPFNRNQVSYVSLRPEDVDLIVFWTKNAGPLIPRLVELDSPGLLYYFQYTVTGYPRLLEPRVPDLNRSIDTFQQLSRMVGRNRVVWRYDPIVFSELTPPSYHEQAFCELANSLSEYCSHVVVSIVDEYRASRGRLSRVAELGVDSWQSYPDSKDFGDTMRRLASCAEEHGLSMYSCAEPINMASYGILPGKCIDEEYIRQTFGIHVCSTKDTSQRDHCGCIRSKDIGDYDTCQHQCIYCYATRSATCAAKRSEQHDSSSPSLLGWRECIRQSSDLTQTQKSLF